MNIIELSLKNYYKPYGHLFVQVGATKWRGGGLLAVLYGIIFIRQQDSFEPTMVRQLTVYWILKID